ncbi:uncharacterized protein C12orf71 homolog [Marmota monax]|uniref:uncharacterized protein C12orf71 homolog n=1 Tax=Marmota monax TaxID=9995 RepID=UPI001EB075D3|nr:uncharacterized protein C12orf71 homolog [Marmota monax]
MSDSSSGISCPDMEHCISQSKSNQSLSVVPFPSEERPDCEAVVACEELTSEGPSSLPPVQGAWGTNDVRGPMGRRNEIQEKPEELGEENMDEPINGEVCSLFDYSKMKWAEWEEDDDESMYDSDEETRCRGVWELLFLVKIVSGGIGKFKKVKGDDSLFSDPPQKEEDVQPSSSVSSHMDQVSPEELEACQDLPKCQRAENGDTKQCSGLEKDEIVEMESQEPGTAKSSLGSSEQSEEGDLPSDKEGTSCMNFRRFFHWLRKRVVSSLPGRKRREKAKKVSSCWR